MIGKRNDEYFVKGRPYLDGFRAVFMKDTGARVAAVRGLRTHAEFRGFPPSTRDDLVRALGDKVVVQESTWLCALYVALNHEKKPFDDARVRRARAPSRASPSSRPWAASSSRARGSRCRRASS